MPLRNSMKVPLTTREKERLSQYKGEFRRVRELFGKLTGDLRSRSRIVPEDDYTSCHRLHDYCSREKRKGCLLPHDTCSLMLNPPTQKPRRTSAADSYPSLLTTSRAQHTRLTA